MKISVITCSIRPEGLKQMQKCLETQTEQDFEWLVEIGLPAVRHDLNAAYNRSLRRAQGDLIVSVQDWTTFGNEYLEKFLKAHTEHPRTLFTSPVGKVKVAFEAPAHYDWRAYKVTDKMESKTWEIDSGCAPKQMFYDVGGFDEFLDQWWSFDNVSVAIRAEMLGYDFDNLFDNPVWAFDHDAAEPHPFRERYRPAKVQLRFEGYKDNPVLPYLV